MHMEGTRHEKVLLIVLAYIIGFTTAFIAFGFGNQRSASIDLPAYTPRANAEDSSDALKASVVFKEDGVYVVTSRYDRILSADKNALSSNVLTSIGESAGFHYRVIDAEASRDAKFVYYCEQLSEASETCHPYVYSVDMDAVFPVKLSGEKVEYVVIDHVSAWMEDGALMIGSTVSADVSRPWELVEIPQ